MLRSFPPCPTCPARLFSRIALPLLLIVATGARAEVVTETLPYTHDGAALTAYLASDNAAAAGPRPAVLVCHAWWGAGEYAHRRARELAELGYVALVLDMYDDFDRTDDPAVAQSKAGPFYKDRDLFRARARAGLDLLLKQPGIDADRVAAIGYCFGGTTALELAYAGAPLKAVVTFHGSLLEPRPADETGVADSAEATVADLDRLTAKLLICHGQADPLYPTEKLVHLIGVLQEAGVDTTTTMYANAVHAFTDPDADSAGIDGVAYDAEADHRSWSQMTAFLDEVFAE